MTRTLTLTLTRTQPQVLAQIQDAWRSQHNLQQTQHRMGGLLSNLGGDDDDARGGAMMAAAAAAGGGVDHAQASVSAAEQTATDVEYAPLRFGAFLAFLKEYYRCARDGHASPCMVGAHFKNTDTNARLRAESFNAYV